MRKAMLVVLILLLVALSACNKVDQWVPAEEVRGSWTVTVTSYDTRSDEMSREDCLFGNHSAEKCFHTPNSCWEEPVDEDWVDDGVIESGWLDDWPSYDPLLDAVVDDKGYYIELDQYLEYYAWYEDDMGNECYLSDPSTAFYFEYAEYLGDEADCVDSEWEGPNGNVLWDCPIYYELQQQHLETTTETWCNVTLWYNPVPHPATGTGRVEFPQVVLTGDQRTDSSFAGVVTFTTADDRSFVKKTSNVDVYHRLLAVPQHIGFDMEGNAVRVSENPD